MLMINGQDVDLRGFKVSASVVHLTLVGCDISEQASETIIMSRTLKDFKDVVSLFSSGRRSHLKRLCLEKCGSTKLTRAIGGMFQLTEIEILSCPNLTLLETGSIGTLHNLRRLSIIDCPKLNKLPDDSLPTSSQAKWRFTSGTQIASLPVFHGKDDYRYSSSGI